MSQIVCILALVAAVLGAKVTTPRFKWGQTKDLIFLSIMVRDLDKKSISVSLPDAGTLSFKAKNSKGEDFALEMLLREDVEIDVMKFELLARSDKWGNVVLVIMGKKNKHRWDVLVADVKKFKSFMDKDWRREDQNLEPEEELPYLEDNADFFIDLTEKNMEKTIQKYTAVIANVRYPWCSQCKSQDETFAKAAKEAKKKSKKDAKWKKVAFAVVDAREQRKLARDLGAKCDYECEYKIFQEVGEPPVVMKSKWSESELIGEVSKYTAPAVHLMKSEDEASKIKEANTTCLGTFVSESSSEYKLFKQVAGMMRGSAVFVASFGKAVGVEMWPHKQNFSFKFDGSFSDNGTALYRWLRPRAIPLLQEYDWQNRATYEELGLPIVKLWLNDEDKNPSFDKIVRHAVRRVAKKYIGKLAFVEQKKSMYGYELRDYGLNHPEMYPAIGIASNGSYTSSKYGFEITTEIAPSVQDFWRDADAAIEKLTIFCEKYLAGSWPVARESGPIQTNWTRGRVKKLVWKSYNEIDNAETPLLLEVYGKYRSENERKQKEIEHLATVLEPYIENFIVASYESTDSYLPPEFKREKYSSDTEWFWVPKHVDVPEKPAIKKLLKPQKDAPIEKVLEFALKQAEVKDSFEELKQKFDKLMVDDPPPTTTPPPDMGGMGGGMGGMGGGMGGMGGLDDMDGMADMMGGMGGLRDEM